MIDESEHIKLGQIYREYGVQGLCKFYSFSGNADHLVEGEAYILEAVDGAQERTKILSIRPYQRYYLIHFDAFKGPEDIINWRKATLWLEKSKLQRRDNEIFDFEWIGFQIMNQNKKLVGTVRQVVHNPLKQFVVVLESSDQQDEAKEVMIPCVDDWILETDTENKTVCMELPEGLI